MVPQELFIMEFARKKIVSNISISDSGCWEWKGCVQSNGYGRITYKRKTSGVHRLSYRAFLGEIPEGHDVCHRCDNRKCVNPSHLFVGTRKDNMEDCVKKGRQAKGNMLPDRRGEKSSFAKLSESDVIEIRDLASSGLPTNEIAKKFNVSADNIRRIKRRDTWSHV